MNARLLSPREVADRYRGRISIWRLWVWRVSDSGGPPWLRIGRRVYYPSRELWEWEQAQIRRKRGA